MVDLQLVKKLQIVFHVAADNQSDFIDLIVTAESDLIPVAFGNQIDGSFNRGIAGADDDNPILFVRFWISQFVFDLVLGAPVVRDLHFLAWHS